MMNQVVTRQGARAAGETRYFTGKPCPLGHVVERMVSTAACSECARLKKCAWLRANAGKANAQSRAWRAKNREKVRAIKRAWNAANPEGQKARSRRWYEANREKANAQHYAWAERNPAKVTAAAARRRARVLRQTPPWADHNAIEAVYARAQLFRAAGFDVHVDHAVPLRGRLVSGLHVSYNLQVTHATINRSKSNHF